MLNYQMNINSNQKVIKASDLCVPVKSEIINSPVNIYLFKVKNRNTRKRCGICSKLMIKTPEQRQ